MPQQSAPAPTVRSLRQTLLIAGLSAVSATILWIWVIGPMLQRGGHDRSETYAEGCCRAYAEAQVFYRRADRDGDGKLTYAHPYTELSKALQGSNNAGLLSDELAAARGAKGVPYHGYIFHDIETVGGKPINWTEDFALCATPAKYGGARLRTFIIRSDGNVWAKDLGRSEFVADFPADPAAAGWQIAE